MVLLEPDPYFWIQEIKTKTDPEQDQDPGCQINPKRNTGLSLVLLCWIAAFSIYSIANRWSTN